LEAWLREQRAQLSNSSSVAKPIDYMLRRWDRFARFVNNGRICLTNNAAERALRGFALGRKSWLFAGSERGADRAAVMATLIMTAKLNDLDPQAWLADVLARIASTRQGRLNELLRTKVCYYSWQVTDSRRGSQKRFRALRSFLTAWRPCGWPAGTFKSLEAGCRQPARKAKFKQPRHVLCVPVCAPSRISKLVFVREPIVKGTRRAEKSAQVEIERLGISEGETLSLAKFIIYGIEAGFSSPLAQIAVRPKW
jgi:hypothetical protein